MLAITRIASIAIIAATIAAVVPAGAAASTAANHPHGKAPGHRRAARTHRHAAHRRSRHHKRSRHHGRSHHHGRPAHHGPSSQAAQGPTCTTTVTSPGALYGALTSANRGQVLCLGSGSYDGITLASFHPSRTVMVQPAPNAAVTLGLVTLRGVSNVTVTGFSGSSSSGGLAAVGDSNGPNTNITFSYNAMSSNGVNIAHNDVSNANITIAHNRFVGFASSGEQDRVLVNTANVGHCPNGVVISHNLMQGGESDGTDIDGGTCGTQILNNVYTGILEANCNGIHCDAIQDNGGGSNTTISGNYFYGNSDGLLFDDGSSGDRVVNNVFDNPTYRCVEGEFGAGSIFVHNTFNCEVNVGQDHSGATTNGLVFDSNVLGPSGNSGITYYPSCGGGWGSFALLDYNLHPAGDYGCKGNGPHDLVRSPRYVGGANPSSYSGWALAGGSPGVHRASDGTNMGADVSIAPGP